MWWPILLILLQAAFGAVPAWAVLWLVDRLKEDPERPIDVEELRAAWEEQYGAESKGTPVVAAPQIYTNFAKARADYHRKLLEGGMTLDEAREAMGYPPFGDLP